MDIHISVRSLVEFILRSGNIDNRRTAASDNAMQEGSRIHRMIQRRMGPEYQAETGLRYTYNAGEYEIVVEGRADGIITESAAVPENDSLVQKPTVTIDEIKGTFQDLKKLKGPVPVHLAQAKCYAYIYAEQKNLPEIRVRMTYCHIETEQIRYFHYDFTFEELQEWFLEVMEQYRKWADYSFKWQKVRQESIKALQFPMLTGKDRRSWQPMSTGRSITRESFLLRRRQESERQSPRYFRL